MGKKVYVECKFKWPKVREEDRDMGQDDGSEASEKIKSTQGQYIVHLYIDKEAKEKMIADGVPNTGLQANLFKEDDEGKDYFKATRPHFNPRFTNKETGEKGVIMGPPKVYKGDTGEDGKPLPWDYEQDGLWGNWSKGVAKLDVWSSNKPKMKGKDITTLEALLITDPIPYEDSQDDGGF